MQLYSNKNIYLRGHHDERPPLLKGHISSANGVASQEGVLLYYKPK